jgi:hypothetical protein
MRYLSFFYQETCGDGIADDPDAVNRCPLGEGMFHVLKAVVVLELWVSCLGVFAWAETIALEVIPIVLSFRSILPLLIWTIVMWVAIADLLYILQGPNGKNALVMLSDTFYFLFVGDTEIINPYHDSPVTDPDHMSDFPILVSPIMIFLLIFIIIFTVWILNIFIGVIGDAFNLEKDQVQQTFQQERCTGVLRYLLRATIIPSKLRFLPKSGTKGMYILRWSMVIIMLTLLISTWFVPGILGTYPMLIRVPVYFVMVFLLNVLPFQWEAVPWATGDHPAGLSYLWVVKQADLSELEKEEDEEEEEEEE